MSQQTPPSPAQSDPASATTAEPSQTVPARPGTPARGLPGKPPNGTADPATLSNGCRCGKRWNGGRTCHCGACHHTFTGVTAFDQHRRGGQCQHPASIGLTVQPGRAYECWGNSEEER